MEVLLKQALVTKRFSLTFVELLTTRSTSIINTLQILNTWFSILETRVTLMSRCKNQVLRIERDWRNCGAASVGEWNTKLWFINGVDNVNWPPYRDSISVPWSIYIINSVDKPNQCEITFVWIGENTLARRDLMCVLRISPCFWMCFVTKHWLHFR